MQFWSVSVVHKYVNSVASSKDRFVTYMLRLLSYFWYRDNNRRYKIHKSNTVKKPISITRNTVEWSLLVTDKMNTVLNKELHYFLKMWGNGGVRGKIWIRNWRTNCLCISSAKIKLQMRNRDKPRSRKTSFSRHILNSCVKPLTPTEKWQTHTSDRNTCYPNYYFLWQPSTILHAVKHKTVPCGGRD
jgi:hypothetical protein